MRLNIEWLWFAQFDWHVVLLRRWLWQFGGFCFGLALSISCLLWQQHWLRIKSPLEEKQIVLSLKGWSYSFALLACLFCLTGDLLLLSRFTWLAWINPFSLAHWWAEPFGYAWAWLLAILAVFLAMSFSFGSFRVGRIAQLVGSIGLCITIARAWGLWALAMRIPQSGIREQLLGADVSFGMGRFPALAVALVLLLLLLTLTASTSFWIRLTSSKALSDWQFVGLSRAQTRYLRPLLSLLLINLAALLWLSRHQLLWTQNGMIAGAGWLDAQLIIPVRSISSLALLSLAVFVIPIPGLRKRGLLRLLAASIALVGVVVELVFAPFIQWMVVKPRELELETPYISRAIKATRKAFQLDSITTRLINPHPQLTKADLEVGASTLRNIRLWDSQPLLATNRQLQQLRVYYRFSNAAVDRYRLLPLSKERQQVMITARELDQAALPKRSRTWLNRHFVFTHGYGFTLSPVNTMAPDGLPDYFISDLGTSTKLEGSKELGITREDVKQAVPIAEAALYFGILPSPYAIAPTKLKELDYPEGDQNIYNHYSGLGGIPLENPLQRISAATYLHEPRLLNTGSLNQNSKLLIRREVRQRIRAVAPFLELTEDPYLVSVAIPKNTPNYNSDQHQYWIVEGYTTSRTYPYAANLPNGEQLRYLRNSVKAIVDAYSGRIHLYIIEPDDPLIQGWQNVFPELFKSLDAMPLALREHLRVPTNLFNIQVQQLLRYHVTDPRVFYSGDDVWQVPMELYGKRQVPVLPYHTTAQLRPNDQSEFLLLQPLTPLARPNLSGWLAARSDGEHYGELVLLRFPSETLIFGPEQIQALINQNPTISQQFGLWDRAGSEVVQGNLLVVPLGNALLYVEPVYLKAQQGGLPTLARVVVSDGKRIAMAENLADGLRALLEGSNKRSIVLEVKNLPPSMMTGSE